MSDPFFTVRARTCKEASNHYTTTESKTSPRLWLPGRWRSNLKTHLLLNLVRLRQSRLTLLFESYPLIKTWKIVLSRDSGWNPKVLRMSPLNWCERSRLCILSVNEVLLYKAGLKYQSKCCVMLRLSKIPFCLGHRLNFSKADLWASICHVLSIALFSSH